MFIHPKKRVINKIRTAQTVEEVLSLALAFLECEWGQKLKAQEADRFINLIMVRCITFEALDRYIDFLILINNSEIISGSIKGISFLKFRNLQSYEGRDLMTSMVPSYDDGDDRTPKQKAEDDLVEKIIPEISAENAERVLANIFQSMVNMNFTIREAEEWRDIISSKITKGSIVAAFLRAHFSDEIFWSVFSRKPANDSSYEPS